MTFVKQDTCQPDCPKECSEGKWLCNNKCIRLTISCNKTTCPPGLSLNCEKTNCHKTQKDFECDGKCQKVEEPCSGKCHPSRPLNCGTACLQDNVKVLEREKKWNCNGTCLNFNDSCNGSCYKPNWEINCKGECELKQSLYECNGTCQTVKEKCQGKCSSLGRPWECPTNKNLCVSEYVCSIDEDPNAISLEANECPYIYENYRTVCKRTQEPEKIKCE